jgi:hypothetical protein
MHCLLAYQNALQSVNFFRAYSAFRLWSYAIGIGFIELGMFVEGVDDFCGRHCWLSSKGILQIKKMTKQNDEL